MDSRSGFFISYAYHLERFRISGAVPCEVYRVEADHGSSATEEDVRQMVQSLLAERIKAGGPSSHEEEDGYALTGHGAAGPHRGGYLVRCHRATAQTPQTYPQSLSKAGL